VLDRVFVRVARGRDGRAVFVVVDERDGAVGVLAKRRARCTQLEARWSECELDRVSPRVAVAITRRSGCVVDLVANHDGAMMRAEQAKRAPPAGSPATAQDVATQPHRDLLLMELASISHLLKVDAHLSRALHPLRANCDVRGDDDDELTASRTLDELACRVEPAERFPGAWACIDQRAVCACASPGDALVRAAFLPATRFEAPVVVRRRAHDSPPFCSPSRSFLRPLPVASHSTRTPNAFASRSSFR